MVEGFPLVRRLLCLPVHRSQKICRLPPANPVSGRDFPGPQAAIPRQRWKDFPSGCWPARAMVEEIPPIFDCCAALWWKDFPCSLNLSVRGRRAQTRIVRELGDFAAAGRATGQNAKNGGRISPRPASLAAVFVFTGVSMPLLWWKDFPLLLHDQQEEPTCALGMSSPERSFRRGRPDVSRETALQAGRDVAAHFTHLSLPTQVPMPSAGLGGVLKLIGAGACVPSGVRRPPRRLLDAENNTGMAATLQGMPGYRGRISPAWLLFFRL
jgi:hypothetical protein